jgi:hypothetical protein
MPADATKETGQMKRFRALIAPALSLALVVLSPGSGAYHAAALTMNASVRGSAVNGIRTGLGRATGVNVIATALAPNLSAPVALAAPSAGLSAAPSAIAAPNVGLTAALDDSRPVEASVAESRTRFEGGAPVDYVVMFGDKKTALHDSHIANVDVNVPEGVDQYTNLQQSMLAQLETAGLGSAGLAPYKATPIATYARINTATIRVDGASAAAFTRDMAARGFKVYPNSQRKIVRPVPVTPEQMDPSVRGAVTMDENLQIVKADAVQTIAKNNWGKPELGFWSGLWAKAYKSVPAQPKFGVIDSGADISHPLLRRIKEVKNMTSGKNIDDIGHGSWVHSTVLHMAPWSRATTHYKTFLNGGATLDDILRSLTQSGNDGNLVISNSWGSDDGDPKSPDSELVRKLAQEGHVMVFAAGNAGSGRNTIGSPAIVSYKDPKTGAIRVMSVAAAGRDKKIAYFSSRGPGSPISAKIPGYPHRPDLTAVGYNIEGAWPEALNEADRVDGEKGPVKAISGTSMSTPGVAGALALLAMMFGVTEKGAKLDAVVNAVMATLEKTGQSADAEGQGFLNVTAAYESLYKTFNPGATPPTAVMRYREAKRDLAALDSRINASYRASAANDARTAAQEFPDLAANRRKEENRTIERLLKVSEPLVARIAALEAEYPGIRGQAANPAVRAWRSPIFVPVAFWIAMTSILAPLMFSHGLVLGGLAVVVMGAINALDIIFRTRPK